MSTNDKLNFPRLFTREEAAQYLRLQVQTLAKWATQNCGPRYVKMGRSVRYRPCDLAEFLRASVVETGSGDAG